MVRLAVFGTLLWMSVPHEATAQVKGDVEFRLGVNKRFSSGVPAGAAQPSFGPSLDVMGHVALMPMVRVGAYGGYELSPQLPYPARHLVRFGLQLRVLSPFLSRPWRMWLSVGFGPAFAFGPSDAQTVSQAGRLFEVPVGVGFAHHLWGRWEVTGEVLARPAFGHGGSLFEARGTGTDALGLGLAVGLQCEW